MSSSQNTNFHDCLSAQPRKDYPSASKATQELASELLTLLNDDSAKAVAIIRQIMYYSPNQSIEWYYEQAVAKLTLQLHNLII